MFRNSQIRVVVRNTQTSITITMVESVVGQIVIFSPRSDLNFKLNFNFKLNSGWIIFIKYLSMFDQALPLIKNVEKDRTMIIIH